MAARISTKRNLVWLIVLWGAGVGSVSLLALILKFAMKLAMPSIG